MVEAVEVGMRAAPQATEHGERVPIRSKIAFGIGNGAESVAMIAVSYAMLFYNQILGLPAHLAGLAVSISLIFDGLWDPFIGSLSDRTRSRLGRRHPYMFAGPVPIAASLVALFNPPAGLGDIALFGWFAVCIIVLRTSMTCFHTPHLALGGELSRDYTERSRVMAYNQFFNWAGQALATWVALTYFFKATAEYPRGLLNPQPWTAFSWATAGLALVLLLTSAIFTVDRVPLLPKPPPNLPKFTPFEFLKDLGRVLSNRNYLWLLIAFFFMSIMVGVRGALLLYTNTYYWRLSSEDLRWFVVGSFAGYISGFMITAWLHQRFGKRRTMIVAATFYVIGPALPIIAGGMGWLTPTTPGLVHILVALSAVGYLAASVNAISVASALADIADENELRFGLRQEGVLYSTRTLFSKIDIAIGTALAGFILSAIKFPAHAKVDDIPHEIVWTMALWEGVICCIPGLIAVVFYGQFSISREKHAQTRAALAEQRREREAVA